MTEKETFVIKFNEAFAKSDVDLIMECLHENIVWNFIGQQRIEGKESVREALKEMQCVETLDMEIAQVLVSGSRGSVHGRMKIRENSNEVKSFGFADFYEFDQDSQIHIRIMTSYIVPLKED